MAEASVATDITNAAQIFKQAIVVWTTVESTEEVINVQEGYLAFRK